MTETKINEIDINGVKYVPKDSNIIMKAASLDGMQYVIVRTYSAGYLKSRSGQEVVMVNARRIWYWAGAASLSQLAIDGTSKPKDCKFPAPVSKIELTQAIEILDCTAKAQQSIEGVSEWKM